jgi:low affinity Fe/Cu permease
MKEFFRKFSHKTSEIMGSPVSFIIALVLLLAWGISGPIFDFSDTWQLAINTTTTIITFLMVFLIQNTQNRDAKAIHLKLDELILSMQGARNTLVNLEELSDDQIEQLQKQFRQISKHYSKLTHTVEEIEVDEKKNQAEEE